MIPKGLPKCRSRACRGSWNKLKDCKFNFMSIIPGQKLSFFLSSKKKIPIMGPYGPPQCFGPPKKVRGVPPCVRPCSYQRSRKVFWDSDELFPAPIFPGRFQMTKARRRKGKRERHQFEGKTTDEDGRNPLDPQCRKGL